MMKYRIKAMLLLGLLISGVGVAAEPEEWVLADGETFSAELVKVMSDYVLFRDDSGNTQKIELNRFAPESLLRLQLANPPRLTFDLMKDRNSKVFSAGISEVMQRPPEQRNRYGIRVKQESASGYVQRLDVEVFVIGRELLGNQFILLDRFSSPFELTKENRREFEFWSKRRVVLRNYTLGGQRRGEDYFGYLAVVQDLRGETIGLSASHNWLSEHVEELRKRQIGNFMDKTCARVFPTRPPSRTH